MRMKMYPCVMSPGKEITNLIGAFGYQGVVGVRTDDSPAPRVNHMQGKVPVGIPDHRQKGTRVAAVGFRRREPRAGGRRNPPYNRKGRHDTAVAFPLVDEQLDRRLAVVGHRREFHAPFLDGLHVQRGDGIHGQRNYDKRK